MVSNAFAAVDNISITHRGDAESLEQLPVPNIQSQTNYYNNVEWYMKTILRYPRESPLRVSNLVRDQLRKNERENE